MCCKNKHKGNATLQEAIDIQIYDILQFKVPKYKDDDKRAREDTPNLFLYH